VGFRLSVTEMSLSLGSFACNLIGQGFLRKIINVGSLACDDQSLGINASELVLGN
jgi:hypothetical protein